MLTLLERASTSRSNLLLSTAFVLSAILLGGGILIASRYVNAKTIIPPRSFANIQYAERFPGATWDVKVRAALQVGCPNKNPNQLPMLNGLIDARGLVGSQTIGSTVAMPPNCTLLVGSGVFRLSAGAQLLYDTGDKIVGTGANGRGTQITNTNGDTTPMIAYVNGVKGVGAFSPEISELQIYGSSTAGSVGLDMRHTLSADIHDLNIANVDIGIIIGFPGACDCYNSFSDVFAYGITYGAKFLGGSNQNQWYGGRFGGSTGLYLEGGADQFFSADFELDQIGVHFVAGGTGNSLFTPYFEANKTNVLIDPGVYSNAIIGGSWSGGIRDNSENTSNWMFGVGSSAAPGGFPPKAFGARQFNIGGNLEDSGAAHLAARGGVDGGVDLDWSKQITAIYGREGGANLHSGALYSVGGADLNATTVGSLPNPSAPTITPHGLPGTTTYSYYVVCYTPTGDLTLPSPAGSISRGSARLSSSNYNIITYSCGAGFNGADILKDEASGNVVLLANRTNTSPNGSLKDIGQMPSAYTPPSRNTTGDIKISGMSISEGIRWPLPRTVVNGASFYCPNCDEPTSPPGVCTSSSTRTGSWVHGLNNRWICVP